MHSDSLKCDICSLALTDSEALTRHRADVHIDRGIRCESCARFFTNKQEFEKHSIKVHGNGPRSGSNLGIKKGYVERVDDKESTLLKRTMEEDKARKRTRGPYRKSAIR